MKIIFKLVVFFYFVDYANAFADKNFKPCGVWREAQGEKFPIINSRMTKVLDFEMLVRP